ELPLETFNLQQGGNNWQNQQKIVNNLTNQGGSHFGANPGSVFGAIQHAHIIPMTRFIEVCFEEQIPPFARAA
ncbi:MAG: hypothetical protein RPT95_13595, partial [Candidatus Sedimenticola sp. (ex Thyasira tokunagai)]